MHNETLSQLFARKSVRVFEDRPVSPEMKALLLEAAFQAPTAGNQMLYTILDITDQELKNRLAVTCDHQPFIATAPVVLIFLADCRRWYDSYRFGGAAPRQPGAGDLLLAAADALIAAQNLVVAAQSLGLGSCYIGDILEQCETHRQLLNLPPEVVPAAMVVAGWPTPQQQERKKPARFDSRYIVFENRYRTLEPQEHRAMHEDQARRDGRVNYDYQEAITRFCERKYQSDFSREMTRSALEYLKGFPFDGISPNPEEPAKEACL